MVPPPPAPKLSQRASRNSRSPRASMPRESLFAVLLERLLSQCFSFFMQCFLCLFQAGWARRFCPIVAQSSLFEK